MKSRLFYILIIILTISCKDNQVYKYHFSRPIKTTRLDKKLNEISGLNWLSDTSLACVQDERAEVYFINPNNGKIIETIDFNKKGDFEGIVAYNNRLYLLRSDGNLFVSTKKGKLKEYKFKKDGVFDFEGMCLDEKNNRLLLACKSHGNKHKRDNQFVYEFSLKDKSFDKDPVFKLEKEGKIPVNFKASGIAIHPMSAEIYIISSFSKTILILLPDGTLKESIQLNESIYHQPEGITFSKEGGLFISNEKNKKHPTLIQINYIKI